MKKRTLIFAMALAVAVVSVACSSSSSEKKESQTVATQEETEAKKDALDFMEKGEVYFDINLSSGVFDDLKIKVGDQEISKTGKVKYKSGDAVVAEGEGNGSDIFVVAYSADENPLFSSVQITTKDLQKTLDIIFKAFAGEKTYVLISDKADGFDHSLNAFLTEYLKGHIAE